MAGDANTFQAYVLLLHAQYSQPSDEGVLAEGGVFENLL
jgi:hypothetical protein